MPSESCFKRFLVENKNLLQGPYSCLKQSVSVVICPQDLVKTSQACLQDCGWSARRAAGHSTSSRSAQPCWPRPASGPTPWRPTGRWGPKSSRSSARRLTPWGPFATDWESWSSREERARSVPGCAAGGQAGYVFRGRQSRGPVTFMAAKGHYPHYLHCIPGPAAQSCATSSSRGQTRGRRPPSRPPRRAAAPGQGGPSCDGECSSSCSLPDPRLFHRWGRLSVPSL